MIQPKLYATDGLAADEIFKGLRPALDTFRQRHAGAHAVALYQSGDSADDFVMSSESRRPDLDAANSNEPLALSHSFASEPSVIRSLVETSQIRDYQQPFAVALGLPRVDAFGAGAVLIDHGLGASELLGRRYHRRLTELSAFAADLARSRLQATSSIQLGLIQAMRSALSTGVLAGGAGWRLRFVVQTARIRLRAEKAYLRMSMDEHSTRPTSHRRSGS